MCGTRMYQAASEGLLALDGFAMFRLCSCFLTSVSACSSWRCRGWHDWKAFSSSCKHAAYTFSTTPHKDLANPRLCPHCRISSSVGTSGTVRHMQLNVLWASGSLLVSGRPRLAALTLRILWRSPDSDSGGSITVCNLDVRRQIEAPNS